MKFCTCVQNAPELEKFIFFFFLFLTQDINVCKGLLGDSDGVCVLNVWDEYKKLDYQKIYDNMKKPSFVFNGRNKCR
jgi:UDP-glucose 6-dehydrogenase